MSEQVVREPVKWFAAQMEQQLLANDDKGGWGVEQCSMNYLLDELDVHTQRYLGNHGSGNSKEELIQQLADIANYAMMQADRLRQSNGLLGKCDWCDSVTDQLSHPHMFDMALGKKMCKECWNHDRDVYKGSYGEDIGEFYPIKDSTE